MSEKRFVMVPATDDMPFDHVLQEAVRKFEDAGNLDLDSFKYIGTQNGPEPLILPDGRPFSGPVHVFTARVS